MTIKEKYGTFENYEKELVLAAIEGLKETISLYEGALSFKNSYMADTHLSAGEARVRLTAAKEALKGCYDILSGRVHSAIYRHRWDRMKDTEAN
jgi:hypothetical protein